ncbi:TRAP transporter substrate-binding protein [Desulfovibrio sp. OttesenSCG-928-I05]|nr:TRAP transporter substrate-binding protein [Desulfovibrio sp. OttesenSCG-928-I05]
MKRVILAMSLCLIFACGNAMAAPVKLRLAHANAPTDDSVFQVVGLKYKELVEKYSNGEIQISIFASGQIGGEEELVTYTKEGTVDLACASLNQVSNHAPGLEALFLPYMFPDTQSMKNALNATAGDFNDYLIKRANMRLAGLITLGDYGYRQVLSLKPVKSIDDLRKMKVRVPANPVMTAAFVSFGITPTPIAWGELYNSLQTGVVDAFECDVSVLVSARYNEVIKYVTDINYVQQISLLIMSQDTYARLSDAHKAVIDRASKEVNEFMETEGPRLGKLAVDQSTKVEFLGRPADFDKWVEAGRTVWPQFYKRIGDGDEAAGKALVDKVFAASQGK